MNAMRTDGGGTRGRGGRSRSGRGGRLNNDTAKKEAEGVLGEWMRRRAVGDRDSEDEGKDKTSDQDIP